MPQTKNTQQAGKHIVQVLYYILLKKNNRGVWGEKPLLQEQYSSHASLSWAGENRLATLHSIHYWKLGHVEGRRLKPSQSTSEQNTSIVTDAQRSTLHTLYKQLCTATTHTSDATKHYKTSYSILFSFIFSIAL